MLIMAAFLCSGLEHATGMKAKHSPWLSRLGTRFLFEGPADLCAGESLNGNRDPYQFCLLHFRRGY